MKKTLLLSLLFSYFLIGGQAQSLVLYNGDTALGNGAEIVVSGAPNVSPTEISLIVKNNSASSLDVKVRRTDLALLDDTYASFCWGANCFSPFTIVSPEPQTIAPGGSNDTFRGDYIHNGKSGISRVQYSFFDERNLADSTWIIVLFDVAEPLEQSLQLTYLGNVIANNQEIAVLIDPLVNPGSVYAVVKNINTVPVSVKVKKYDLSILENTEVSFCWGESCYPPTTYVSPDAVLLESMGTDDSFHGDYTHNAIEGVSKVRFTFFTEGNRNDSISFLIKYTVGHLGIDANAKAGASISNVYPNPATSASFVDYKLPKSVTGASLRVNNLLGVTVMEIPLDRNEGKATINVSNLKEGIYFYSLIVNNSATHTRKFVVKR